MANRCEHVVARNVAELREERRWSQVELARRMAASGLGWTPNRAAQIESLRGTVNMVEVLGLCWTFQVPLSRLLAGDDTIELPGGHTVPLADLRAGLGGRGAQHYVDSEAEGRTREEELRRVAANLGLSASVLHSLATHHFGRGFVDEREDRVGDMTGIPKRSAATLRGHATRQILTELTDVIEKTGIAGVERIHQRRIANELRNGSRAAS